MLTLQYIPYGEVASLSPSKRLTKLLEIAKENKIILLEGRLDPQEEARLIEKTMEEISSTFKGIEICAVNNVHSSASFKSKLAKFLLGNQQGLTIIGPASIVKEIKKDPNKIELLTQEIRKNGKRRR